MQDTVLLLPPSQDTLRSVPLDPLSFSIYLLSHRRFWTGLCLNVPCSEHCTEKRQKKLFLLVLTHKVWTLNFPPVIALLLYEKKKKITRWVSHTISTKLVKVPSGESGRLLMHVLLSTSPASYMAAPCVVEVKWPAAALKLAFKPKNKKNR